MKSAEGIAEENARLEPVHRKALDSCTPVEGSFTGRPDIPLFHNSLDTIHMVYFQFA